MWCCSSGLKNIFLILISTLSRIFKKLCSIVYKTTDETQQAEARKLLVDLPKVPSTKTIRVHSEYNLPPENIEKAFSEELDNTWVQEDQSKLLQPDPEFAIEVGNSAVTVDALPSLFKLSFPRQEKFFERHFKNCKYETYGGNTKIGMGIISYAQKENGTVLLVRDGKENNFYETNKQLSPSEFLKYINSPFEFDSLKKLEIPYEAIAEMDEKFLIKSYKFGVIYCADNQTEEKDWFNNEVGSLQFDKFVNILGQKIKLEGWEGYRGGLDCNSNTTGTHSIYTEIEGYDVMFHVSTMLEHSNDEQQINKKRFIGNDIVIIIFKEGNTKIVPKFRSHFNHIFIVVQEDEENFGNYLVGVARKSHVTNFGPPIPSPPSIPAHLLREFILYKALNAEWNCYSSKEFKKRLSFARQGQMELVINKYSS